MSFIQYPLPCVCLHHTPLLMSFILQFYPSGTANCPPDYLSPGKRNLLREELEYIIQKSN